LLFKIFLLPEIEVYGLADPEMDISVEISNIVEAILCMLRCRSAPEEVKTVSLRQEQKAKTKSCA
jgi:hypothetical protein